MKMDSKHTIIGKTISSGLGEGRVFVYHDILTWTDTGCKIDETEVKKELLRFERVFNKISEELGALVDSVKREISRELSAVFKAHIAFLHDPSLKTEVQREIKKENISAESAVRKVFLWWEQRFRLSESEIAKQKADDIRDLARRLLLALAGVENNALEDLTSGSVLLATHLLPSDMVFLANRAVSAILIECGAPASHAALFARELGLPCVGGLSNLVTLVPEGSYALVDADAAKVVFNPDQEYTAIFRTMCKLRSKAVMAAQSRAHEPAISPLGTQVPVFANVGCRKDTLNALENGADGIGLYRVESSYIGLREPPNFETLLREMQSVMEPMKGLPICVRLLDIGADKTLPYVESFFEHNPSLGCRGIRFLLEYPHFLKTQLRALLQLSREYELSVLVPMVTLPQELIKVKEFTEELAKELHVTSIPPIGAMIETPAAALSTEKIAQYADFLSFGTNDLTQYAFAADRENTYVAGYFDDTHEAIFKLLELAQSAAPDKPFSICGELAGYPEFTFRLLNDTGISSFSVVPPLIPLIKESIRRPDPSTLAKTNIIEGEKSYEKR
ncbi:MAG: phosphoenolpyruvate--protein phosphotransferase [Spirochaetia bacterium]|nr:phosphoenolpyruvate--protein phosphotransferase [Spirochaetia bacterium]